jgi:hypothetical protein
MQKRITRLQNINYTKSPTSNGDFLLFRIAVDRTEETGIMLLSLIPWRSLMSKNAIPNQGSDPRRGSAEAYHG